MIVGAGVTFVVVTLANGLVNEDRNAWIGATVISALFIAAFFAVAWLIR
jgi:uncharacterized membrane protein